MSEVENIPDVGKKIRVSGAFLDINDSIEIVKVKLKGAVKNFITVGIVLQEINEKEIYKEKGFSNIYDFSKDMFQLGKNQTYNLINVAKKFSCYGEVSPYYQNFSFSQLVEMLSLPCEELKNITAETTVKEIREVKKKSKQKKEVHADPEVIEGQLQIVDGIIAVAHFDGNEFHEVEVQKQEVSDSVQTSKQDALKYLEFYHSAHMDLNLAIEILNKAWSCEPDDSKADILNKQIEFIKQFNI